MPYADPKRGAEYRAKWKSSPKQLRAARQRYHAKRDANICVMPYCGIKTSSSNARCDRCRLQGRLNKALVDPAERVKARQALENFNGCCDGCGAVKSERDCRLDHDHRTGKFRGILCHHCNTGLGHFFDDVEKLQAAIVYLQKSRGAV